MKQSCRSIAISVLVLFFALPLAALSDGEQRQEMIDSSRRETAALFAKEIPAGELGEWKNTVDASLFLLFRKTELYRGPMRVLVIEEPDVQVRLYPDGTFVISSGLLDWIDLQLFESAPDSTRRIFNFDSEREAMLVPFLVPEAAHFALDHPFRAWRRSRGTVITPNEEEALDADRFSVILLGLAGFDASVMEEWIETLAAKFASDTVDPVFSGWLASFPSPEIRLASIRNTAVNVERITDEFSGVLDALRQGIPMKDSAESLEALADMYPGSPYVARLEALASHLRWLETVPVSEQLLPTFFPFAAEGSGTHREFLALAKKPLSPKSGTAFASAPAVSDTTACPGDAELFAAAETFYAAALEMTDDPELESSHARLLAREGKAGAAAGALAAASDAAAREAGSRSFIARANYAALLFLTGADYAKAQNLAESLGAVSSAKPDDRYLDAGIPGDSRDLGLSHALMLRSLGDAKRAAAKTAEAETLFKTASGSGTIDLRHVRIGDPVDTLNEKWGRPATIIYNYYNEIWIYQSLSASALVVGNKVTLVTIGPRSPVSPGGDIRTGDARADFEAFFGKPVYRAGDCEVYLKDGNRISVLYLGNRIRSMKAGL